MKKSVIDNLTMSNSHNPMMAAHLIGIQIFSSANANPRADGGNAWARQGLGFLRFSKICLVAQCVEVAANGLWIGADFEICFKELRAGNSITVAPGV